MHGPDETRILRGIAKRPANLRTSVGRLSSPTKVAGQIRSCSSAFDRTRERCSINMSSSANAFGERCTSVPPASSSRVSESTEKPAKRKIIRPAL
jgi:hypothetical protein